MELPVHTMDGFLSALYTLCMGFIFIVFIVGVLGFFYVFHKETINFIVRSFCLLSIFFSELFNGGKDA